MQYTEIGNTWYKLSLIASHARRDTGMQFTSLAHLLDEEFLKDCYDSLNRNKAVGIDMVSHAEYGRELEGNLKDLVVRLKRGSYNPKPSRRVYIPKDGKEFRPLGISALENKIVERGIATILEAIYEQDFLECSYGFRPKRNAHQALKQLDNQIVFQPVNHIVEADIKGFFDNVSHDLLMEFLQIRIKDRSLLQLIEKFLKAGYIDDGVLVKTDKGTPQGSILSPMLANIFLHYVLDVWFKEMVLPNVEGLCELIRYADDFVILVQYEREAKRIEKGLQNRFNKYELKLHPQKSRTFSFGRFERENSKNQNRKANTFNFLGFTHYCDRSRKGFFKIGRKTSRKKYASSCKEMNRWLKSIRNLYKTKDWWSLLKVKLLGHYQYYGVSDNYRNIAQFYHMTLKLVHKWINRRSQKRKMSVDGFYKYLEHYPLPKPEIVHNLYMLQGFVS
jgi:group II intron reverse transcriptase/maturase